MQKIPRSIGIPPLSDSGFDQALTLQAHALAASSAGAGPSSGGQAFNLNLGDDEGKINPLAGMGLTDEQYTMILSNMVNGEENFMGIGPVGVGVGVGGMGGMAAMGMGIPIMGVSIDGSKRGLDDPEDTGRDGKRGRFEVIE